MIYFKIFYDIIYNLEKVRINNSNLKINKVIDNKKEIIIIHLNKKGDLFNESFNKIYSSMKISKKELDFILSNIHVIIWKNPWIKCKGSFDISGRVPNSKQSEFKMWYSLKEKKYTSIDDIEYYIRATEPDNCEYIFTNKNMGINSEKFKKLYTKVKNILFDEIKDLIYYVDSEF